MAYGVASGASGADAASFYHSLCYLPFGWSIQLRKEVELLTRSIECGKQPMKWPTSLRKLTCVSLAVHPRQLCFAGLLAFGKFLFDWLSPVKQTGRWNSVTKIVRECYVFCCWILKNWCKKNGIWNSLKVFFDVHWATVFFWKKNAKSFIIITKYIFESCFLF